jgi:tryptophanyl-tRNA synthetase
MSNNELVFSGVQPSGAQVHLGNYLGAMKHFVTLSKKFPTTVCVVDLHALTSVEDSSKLIENTKSLTAAYLAIGLDPEETTIFRQSDIPEVCELAWYLACQFPLGLLERAVAVKDAKAKGLNVNSGLMYYPILMAADILLYRATKIPVGADQKQHLEMTREVVEKFNHRFGEFFPMPEPLIAEDAGTIIGLDGRKMSKSYDNYIGLFEPTKSIEKKVKKITTDSKGVEEAKDPDTCNVFSLFKLFATKEEQESLAGRYRAGGMGYGQAKQELFEVIEREVAPLRVNYERWIAQPEKLEEVLKAGAAKARVTAMGTMTEVRKLLGVNTKL